MIFVPVVIDAEIREFVRRKERERWAEPRYGNRDYTERGWIAEGCFGKAYPAAEYVNQLSHDYVYFNKKIEVKGRRSSGFPQKYYEVLVDIGAMSHEPELFVFGVVSSSTAWLVGWIGFERFKRFSSLLKTGMVRDWGVVTWESHAIPIHRLNDMRNFDYHCRVC